MTIKSEVRKGLIYAGDTPLACTITVEQTGPLQLTIKAGAFCSTGQAHILDAGKVPDLAAMIAAGKAEMMPDSQRVRVWIQDSGGNPIDKAKTYTLAADVVLEIVSDPNYDTLYEIDLISDGAATKILMQSKLDDGIEDYADYPAGWSRVHDLIYEFRVPAGAADISDIDIFVLEVRPGFPPGTGAADWMTQIGST